MVERLSLPAMGAYCVIAMWERQGAYASVYKLAAKCCGGDLEQARSIIAELDRFCLLVGPKEAAEQDRLAIETQEREEQERNAERKNNPPRYTGEVWQGSWPLEIKSEYPDNQSVVYFLYDSNETLIYIGSTKYFLNRMHAHMKDKTWARWVAMGCKNRLEAYRLEADEIAKHLPPLNQLARVRRGADFVKSEMKRRANNQRMTIVRT